jgi:hypothetical protein
MSKFLFDIWMQHEITRFSEAVWTSNSQWIAQYKRKTNAIQDFPTRWNSLDLPTCRPRSAQRNCNKGIADQQGRILQLQHRTGCNTDLQQCCIENPTCRPFKYRPDARLHIKPTCNVVAQQNGTVADLEQ